jgi:hypothetical protein
VSRQQLIGQVDLLEAILQGVRLTGKHYCPIRMGFQRLLAECRFNARRLEVSQKFHRNVNIHPKKRFTGFKQILFGNFGSRQDTLLFPTDNKDNKKYFTMEIYHNDLEKHKRQLLGMEKPLDIITATRYYRDA